MAYVVVLAAKEQGQYASYNFQLGTYRIVDDDEWWPTENAPGNQSSKVLITK